MGLSDQKRLHAEKQAKTQSCGNLGSTLIKRSYLFLEIVLQFLAIADMISRLDARWAVKMDRPFIISILSLLGTSTLLNIFLVFYYAFNNINIPPSQKSFIKTWRPCLQFLLICPCGFLVQQNHMHILFSVGNVVFWSLSAVHLHTFMKESMVKILSRCFPALSNFQVQEEFTQEYENERPLNRRFM